MSINANANLLDDFTAWEEKVFYDQDTNYVRPVSRKLSVKVTNSSWLDVYQVSENRQSVLKMKSDLMSEVEFSVGYSIFFLSYSVGLNQFFSSKDYDCHRFDFNVCWNKIAIECGYARNGSDRTIFSYGNRDRKESIPYSGLKVNMYKARVLYFFNNKKYSNDAIYSSYYSLKQLRSVGSLITGVSCAYHDLNLDVAQLPAFVEVPEETARYEYYDCCLNLGYGYNLVFAKNCLFNFTDIPEMGCKINLTSGRKCQLAINNTIKLSLLYNQERYFTGLSCQYDSYWNLGDDSRVDNSIGTFRLYVGLRF